MTEDFEEKISELIISGEGSIPYMYLDVVGKVTVGVGNMLPTPADAIELGFVYSETGATASDSDIEDEYELILKQDIGRSARYYKPFTKLVLTETDLRSLLKRRLEQFEARLLTDFPDYSQYPEAARLGLMDMAFNLGNSGLVRKFPSFTEAARNGDWLVCAAECRRKQIQEQRNDEVRNLFLSCVEEGLEKPASSSN